jgi:hypothetical protein
MEMMDIWKRYSVTTKYSINNRSDINDIMNDLPRGSWRPPVSKQLGYLAPGFTVFIGE